ncbi:MAG: TIGR02757 family protein [Bacteroidales bacterium]
MNNFLEEKVFLYNRPDFIPDDPICIPHRFSGKADREIAGFLSATLAWGRRKSIVNNGLRLMELMDFSPADFVSRFSEKDLDRFRGFVHRTFCATDLAFFLYSLKNIYQNHGGLEAVFYEGASRGSGLKDGICYFREVFFGIPYPPRTLKHVSNPAAGSAAKRLNMFLRWMIRKDDCGVDFGIWDTFKPRDLYCPLDLHSGRVARRLGLLCRKQNDWKAVEELTATLRQFDADDPVRYDFALFGMGVGGRSAEEFIE